MSFEGEHITDTSVLGYFLLADAFDLLTDLLGCPVQVPTDVYDPDDLREQDGGTPPEDLLSEMRRGIMRYEHKAKQGGSAEDVMRFRQVDALCEKGLIRPILMSEEELVMAGLLRSANEAGRYGIKAVLGAGEAACVAIARHRSWVIVTDDNNALKVMDFLHDNRAYRFERIRKLLKRAADDGFITRSTANGIHRIMTSKGFWDRKLPFPDVE